MTRYPEEFKTSLIAKMLPPNHVSVPDLVRETGISKDTLYSWRRDAQRNNVPVVETQKNGLSSEAKFNVVLETATLNEKELGEYCRRKGLFPLQVAAWRETCIQAHAPLEPQVDKKKLRLQTKKMKRLEKELRRKEKALAEAAALLILQKKVREMWEDPEEEK